MDAVPGLLVKGGAEGATRSRSADGRAGAVKTRRRRAAGTDPAHVAALRVLGAAGARGGHPAPAARP